MANYRYIKDTWDSASDGLFYCIIMLRSYIIKWCNEI